MPEKFTYQEVKDIIEKDGNNILVSKEYINSTEKIEIKCNSCNDNYKLSLSIFQQGRRCAICKKNNRIKECAEMKKQNKYLKVQEIIMEGGDRLVSKEYINSRLQIEICCSKCQNIYKCSLYSFTKGQRCLICLKNNKKNSTTEKNYNKVKNTIESEGDILISTDYVNNHTSLKIQCTKCNNIYEETYKNFTNNMRCHICRRKKCIDKSSATHQNKKETNIKQDKIVKNNRKNMILIMSEIQ